MNNCINNNHYSTIYNCLYTMNVQQLLNNIKTNQKQSATVILSIIAITYYIQQRNNKKLKSKLKNVATNNTSNDSMDPNKPKRVAVDRLFLRRLQRLLQIVLPGYRSREFMLLCMHTSFLVSRTMLSIYVAKLDGSIVKSIVDRNFNAWLKLMIKWILIGMYIIMYLHIATLCHITIHYATLLYSVHSTITKLTIY